MSGTEKKLTRRRLLAYGGAGLATVAASGAGGAFYVQSRVNSIVRFEPARVRAQYREMPHPLLDRFPGLRGKLPWMPLGTFPTPVELLVTSPGDGKKQTRLYAKRDDLSSPLYGGNKVRKLEHVLAEAQLLGARSLLTVGGLGSNQCLATAIHGARLGMKTDLCLFDQPITEHVRQNLLGDAAAGARFVYAGSYVGTAVAGIRRYLARRGEDVRPYYIPPGATSPLGDIGYVSAAFELAEQVRSGALSEPDTLFVPAGSCGTAAGLILGLKLAGLRTRVMAVRVSEPIVVHAPRIRSLALQTLEALRDLDPAVPAVEISTDDFTVVTEYLGDGYGAPTEAARDAVTWAAPLFPQETTYTGKTLAACLDHVRGKTARGTTVLFWNTLNSAPVATASPAALPPELRFVFAPG